ncbi:GNAT family N-acetyltransferase [Plantibacter sp. lyk4-40-MEA-4]|uniref:GNAT family N-acetyltransferase n=1 Tax=Plantibacter sp. lyk4-40-MEA-4 TaxID=3040298 RepID=UPI00254C8FAC|nr:GNAT family N-acetyltransferase [Plantibacter sp. lyk4-40-MEA-4]
MEPEVEIRVATPADAAGLAELKLLMSPPAAPLADWERALFAHDLVSWIAVDPDSRVCLVAVVDDRVVGMAWLVVFSRAPNIGALRRLTGDVQSVFVRPEFRGRGIAGRLIDGLLDAARARDIGRVSVSANEDAAPVYLRAGFERAPLLLEWRAESGGSR